MTPPVHAAIYLRISLDRTGEGEGVERQQEDCEALVRRRGWIVRDVYADNSVSAKGDQERPQWDRMMRDVEAGRVQVVVGWTIDRTLRNGRDRLRMLEVGKAHGITIAIVRGSDMDLSTPSGRLAADILGAVAQAEIDMKADRQRRAREQAAKKGRPVRFSHRPFGWRADRVTLHPAESKAIADACDVITSGGSLRSIAAAWNAAGLTTPQGGKKWLPSVVRGVLLNPRIAGLSAYEPTSQKGERRKLPHEREIVGRGQWTAIVTEEVWRAVVDTLTDASRPRPKGTRTLLGGLARCPCGEGAYSGKNSQGALTLKCARLHRGEGGGGDHVARRAAPVESFVVALALARLSRADALELLKPDTSEAGAAVEALRTRARALRARLAALGEDTELPVPTLRSQVAATGRKLAEVEAELAEAGKSSVLAGVVGADDVTATWEALDLDRQRAIIDALMSVVVLPPGKKGRRAGLVLDGESGEWVADPATIQTTWKV